MASYGDGPLAGELAAAAEQAHGGYREMARYLREDYAPRASERDAVGAERYAVAARISLGADIDPAEAYEWGWAELARIEAERGPDQVRPDLVAARRARRGGPVPDVVRALHRLPRGGARSSPAGGRGHDGGGHAVPVRQVRVRERAR